MADYIDIVATKDGYFCAAPAWEIKEGDLISIPAMLNDKPHEVMSVATDSIDGPFIKMIEKYIGYPLPRVGVKYHKSEVVWNDVPNDQ